jgi:hypothetical protein
VPVPQPYGFDNNFQLDAHESIFACHACPSLATFVSFLELQEGLLAKINTQE